LDRTRVVLEPWPNAPGDFIHANWVTHEMLENRFICTQGPLETTIGDFWRMVWQQKADLILMLCRVTEAGRPKCALYWPNIVGEKKTYNGITIRNETIRSKDADIWGSDLMLEHGGEQRLITHYQWITWPDKFVPQQLVVPFILLSLARQRKQPTVIHCSAGIGRTGTLVALEVFIRSLMLGRNLSISDVIWSLRSQRSKAVQTEEQYLYIHYIVIQRLINKGIIYDKTVQNFCRQYENFYYSRTHMIQLPLPVPVRKPVTRSRRKPNEKIRAVMNDEDINKVSANRRAKCLAISEETLSALRASFNKRSAAILKTNTEARKSASEDSGIKGAPTARRIVSPINAPRINNDKDATQFQSQLAVNKIEQKPSELIGTAKTASNTNHNEDDMECDASFYFMQPEWAYLYPPQRKRANDVIIEEHYVSESLEQSMLPCIPERKTNRNTVIVPSITIRFIHFYQQFKSSLFSQFNSNHRTCDSESSPGKEIISGANEIQAGREKWSEASNPQPEHGKNDGKAEKCADMGMFRTTILERNDKSE
uniref:Protein-tyrosine phosphatase n=1 Tax=Anisakis simplex TaxID=6269 RepID=A0A0M3K1L3_ANISI